MISNWNNDYSITEEYAFEIVIKFQPFSGPRCVPLLILDILSTETHLPLEWLGDPMCSVTELCIYLYMIRKIERESVMM